MARTGRPRKSASQHRLEGNYRADRHAPAAGGPLPALPAAVGAVCPAELSPKAREIWDSVVPELVRLGTLSWPADRGTLTGYCSLLARATALEAIAEATPTVTGKDGLPRAHPCGIEARKLRRTADRIGIALGLSWATRSRIGAPRTPDDAMARRVAAAEAFLFERAPSPFPTEPLTIVKGGKPGP